MEAVKRLVSLVLKKLINVFPFPVERKMMSTKNRFDGYQPRHKSDINYDFCLNRCVMVDGILVPFPDCKRHGKIFTPEPTCVTIEA